MYAGHRDPEIPIIVPQYHCSTYQSTRDGQTYIEIEIPPEYPIDYAGTWGSIMIRPDQIFNVNDGMNMICVNDGAAITVSIKNKFHRIISREQLTPAQIIGRFLKFYRYTRYYANFSDPQMRKIELEDTPSEALYTDMMHMGQTMLEYINRLPIKV